MGKMFKRALATVMVVLIMLTGAPLQGFVELEWPEIDLPDFSEWFSSEVSAIKEIPASGKYSETINYTYDSGTGKLILNGTGKMLEWIDDKTPFRDSDVKTVVIGEGITSVGRAAFYNCDKLESIVIPETVESIEYEAFYDCDALTRIEIPVGVKTVGYSSFESCSRLNSVEISETVEVIKENAFYSCENLEKVLTSFGLEQISTAAFAECVKLHEISIPDSVTYMGMRTFKKCSSLEKIFIPDKVEIIDKMTFEGCSNLKTVIIGNGVRTIFESSFRDCVNMKSIIIGNGLKSVRGAAFYSCDSLLAVCYAGSESEYKNIGVSVDNEDFVNATQYYNTVVSDGHAYQIFDAGLNWNDSQEYCEALGGYLATVSSYDENYLISSIIEGGRKNAYWLGAKKNSDFNWVTNEVFNFKNWADGEPDNYGGNENCIVIYKNVNKSKNNKIGQWNDLKEDGICSGDDFFGLNNIGYVCEWSIEKIVAQKVFCEKSYIADIWLDMYDEESTTPESFLVNSMMSYDSVSKIIYDELRSDKKFRESLDTWNGLKVVFNGVEALNDKLTRTQIYETLLLDLLKKTMSEKENEIQNVILDAVSRVGERSRAITSKKKNIDDVSKLTDFTSSSLLEALKTFKFDPDSELFLTFSDTLGDISDRANVWSDNKYVKGVGEIASISADVDDFYERFAGYCIAVDMAEEMLFYLEQMKKSTNDWYFKNALDNIIHAYNNADFAAVFCTSKLNQNISYKIINGCFEDIAKRIPIYNKLKAVYDAGVTFVNLTMNTSEIIDCYYLCEATKSFMDASKLAVKVLAENYKTSRLENDAGAYVYSIRLYKNVVAIDLETALKTTKAATEKGGYNKLKKMGKNIISLFTGTKEETTYEKLDVDKAQILDCMDSNLWLLDNSWKFNQTYLKTDFPELYDFYIRDEIVDEKYKPIIHSAYLNNEGETIIQWEEPGVFYCENDRGEEKPYVLPAASAIDGIRLEEKIGDYNYSRDIIYENTEKPMIRSYDKKYLLQFPKKYSLSMFSLTVNGYVYSLKSNISINQPLKKVELSLPATKSYFDLFGNQDEYGRSIAIIDRTSSEYKNYNYQIYRQKVGESAWVLCDIIDKNEDWINGNVTVYVDNNSMERGSAYRYKVRSFLTFNDGTVLYSDFSDVFSMKDEIKKDMGTMNIIFEPFEMTRETMLKASNQVEVFSDSEETVILPCAVLDWEPMTGASKYEIYRAASYEQTYSLIGEVDEEVTEYKDYNARNRTTYDYLVLPVKISNGERIYDASICAQGQILYDLGDTYTVTWNMGGMKHVQNYVVGEPLKEPEIYAVKYKKFIGWDKAVPDSMVGENLEFTAIYEDDHVHDYDSMIIDEPTCTSEGRRGFACDCGDDYTEATAKAAHQFTEKIIDSAHLKSAATTSSAAVYKYDCANCDAISDTLTFKHGDPLPSLGKTSKISVTQTTTSIKLSWNKVSDATIYRIYVKQSGEWKTLGDTTALSVTYTKLKPGTIYTYAVKAGKKVGNKIEWASAYTSIKTATKPDATTGLKVASQSETEIKLSWKAVSGATGYRIYSYNTKTKKYESVGYIPGKTAFTVKNLKARTSYKFKVRAYINTDLGAVWGGYTGELVTSTIPGKVSGFKASQNTSEIKLTWKAVSGAVDYRIYQYKPSTGKYYYLATATGKSTSHILKKLKIGTKYMFAFKVAVTLNGKKVYSEYSDVFTTSTKPAKTTGIKVSSQTATSINLTWKAVAGADGYRLYKYDAKKKAYTSIGYVAGKTSFKVNKLKMNETNKFKIRAYINTSLNPKAVWGEYSEILTYKIAPTLTVSSKAKGKATLLWSPINGVDGYEVFYSFSGKSNSYKKLTECNKNVKGLNLSLTSGGKYYFLVRAYIMNGKTRIYSGYNIVSVKVK